MWHLHIGQGIVRLTYTGRSNNSVFLFSFPAMSNTANWPLAVSGTKVCQTISGLVKTRGQLIMLRHAIGWYLRVCLLWLTGVESSIVKDHAPTFEEKVGRIQSKDKTAFGFDFKVKQKATKNATATPHLRIRNKTKTKQTTFVQSSPSIENYYTLSQRKLYFSSTISSIFFNLLHMFQLSPKRNIFKHKTKQNPNQKNSIISL